MKFLALLASALVPTAHAFSLDQVGGTTFSGMWAGITSTFPLTGAGTALIEVMLGRVNTIILSGIATVGVAGIAYAALKLISSGISEQGAEEAKKIIQNVVIGILLAVLSDVIVSWFVSLYTQIGNF